MTIDINNTPYYELPLLSLDTETTGIDVFNDRVVTCNITYDYPDGRPEYICDWLINPGVNIPEGASEVHGVTNEIAQQNGMPPELGLQSIADHLNIWDSYELPIVIYNAPYDITLLRSEFDRYGINCTSKFDRVIDPLVLDKALDKYRKGKRQLTVTAAHYGIVLENAHSADADSYASVKIARAIGKKFKIDSPVLEVHEKQKQLKAEQSADFQNYLRTIKNPPEPDAVINGEWPYIVTRDES